MDKGRFGGIDARNEEDFMPAWAVATSGNPRASMGKVSAELKIAMSDEQVRPI